MQFNAVSTGRIKIGSGYFPGHGAFDSRSGTFSKFSLLSLKIFIKYDFISQRKVVYNLVMSALRGRLVGGD